MAMSRRTGRSRLTLALLVITSLIILTLDFRDTEVVERARSSVAGVLDPVQRGAETVFRPVGNAWNGVTNYGDVLAENEALRDRVAELEGQLALEEAASEQLSDVLKVLDIPWVEDIERVTARVVGGPASNFVHTIDIDKGTDQGLRNGMPVVTGAGLLGRVVQASSSRATVQLLTDPEFRVGVRLSRSGATGTAKGVGQSDELRIDISTSAEDTVARNQLLTTSGTDFSNYPADIPVARVVESEPSVDGLTLDLVARPVVDTGKLSYVTVLLWEPEP